MGESDKTDLDALKLQLARLPEDAREEMVSFLLASLPPPPGVLCEDDPGFKEELLRRIEEIESGTAEMIPHKQVMEELRRKLEQRR